MREESYSLVPEARGERREGWCRLRCRLPSTAATRSAFVFPAANKHSREERERGGEHLVRPLLVGLLDGGDEVLLVHLSAHTSQHAISSSRHLLLLRRRLRCRLLCERLPLEFGGRRR